MENQAIHESSEESIYESFWDDKDAMFRLNYEYYNSIEPALKGKFYKTIIAGHVGTGSRDLADNREYHDIFYDGESHYYIDGSVYKHGKLLLLGYDEESDTYYQVEKNKMMPVKKFEAFR